ncbi:ABC transporter permease [Oceaniradius stylonematis]|uniref:ABC transporter permease n=1 Tax=Oceaniradius stylonematis TaxID=2184161 RepID=UPI000F3ACA81|nr:ABC transporter permease [Oceaniradius stylonematis]RNC96848.1 MAG: ABC transporter permease [Oricola sp.]
MLTRGLAGLAAIGLVWLAAVHLFGVPDFLLPGPVDVAQRLVFLHENARLLDHIQVTLVQIFWGYILGLASGIATAVAFVRLPLFERVSMPVVLLLQTAPKIAIAPLLLLWLGLGPAPKVVLVAIVVFFPVMTGFVSGMRFLPRSYGDLARLLRLTAWQRFWHIELPATMPTLLAGMTVATTLAMTAVVIGELMGANQGIGYLLAAGQESADTATVIGMVLLLSFMGWVFFELFEALRVRIERRFSTA